jgi:hypothetical protein
MNKRIQQLATEAELELTIETKKFAELIVQECASIVDLHGRWVLYDKLAVKIKKHFGVEL